MSNPLTPRDLERQNTTDVVPRASDQLFPLERWYESIRDKPFSEFTTGDLAMACRQQMFLDRVLPKVADSLVIEPLAGEKYDGELLIALLDIDPAFWTANFFEREMIARMAECIKPKVVDADVASEVSRLLSILCSR